MLELLWDSLDVVFAAIAVWLLVRFINLKERLSRRLTRGAVYACAAIVLLYPLSFGPACWLVDASLLPNEMTRRIYLPLTIVLARAPDSIRLRFISYTARSPIRIAGDVNLVGLTWILESY